MFFDQPVIDRRKFQCDSFKFLKNNHSSVVGSTHSFKKHVPFVVPQTFPHYNAIVAQKYWSVYPNDCDIILFVLCLAVPEDNNGACGDDDCCRDNPEVNHNPLLAVHFDETCPTVDGKTSHAECVGLTGCRYGRKYQEWCVDFVTELRTVFSLNVGCFVACFKNHHSQQDLPPVFFCYLLQDGRHYKHKISVQF